MTLQTYNFKVIPLVSLNGNTFHSLSVYEQKYFNFTDFVLFILERAILLLNYYIYLYIHTFILKLVF